MPLSRPVLIIAIVLLLISTGFGLFSLLQANTALEEAVVRESALSDKLASVENDNQALIEALDSEQRQKAELEEELEDLDDKYDDLRRLQRTDPELLAKYSKVYFLSENYAPASLSDIAKEFLARPEEPEQFLRQAYKFLRDLMEDAREDGVDITVLSTYRSFEEQTSLKQSYGVTYGHGANAFSADQGYSEHQLGTAVDFSTKAMAGALTVSFENTEAFAWLTANAHKYGFILSYPRGNAFYQYEPWHWRFIGRDFADDLRDDKESFYDLDQRDIDKYLITLFE